MNLAVRRTREGGLFALIAVVTFLYEEQWAIAAHCLYHHLVLDRTPPWYATALKNALKREHDPEFIWPTNLPRLVPPHWRLTVGELLDNPIYRVEFDTAQLLHEFEPRFLAAFEIASRFIHSYSSRPETLYRRF